MKKILSSPRMMLASMVLLSAVLVGAWFVLRPSNPASEPLVAAPAISLPEQHVSTDEPAAEALPAISPEMATAIRQLSNHSTEGLKETVNPDGSITLNHEDRFQSVMVGVKGPDGKIYIRHGEDFLQNVETQ